MPGPASIKTVLGVMINYLDPLTHYVTEKAKWHHGELNSRDFSKPLTTEYGHPETIGLAELAQDRLPTQYENLLNMLPPERIKQHLTQLNDFLQKNPQYKLNDDSTDFLALFKSVEILCKIPQPDIANVHIGLKQALQRCLAVDQACLNHVSMPEVQSQIAILTQRFQDARAKNKRIFLVGCGASGRLAEVARTIFLNSLPEKEKTHFSPLVTVVMAGGDRALIASVEQFEDKPHFGVDQLKLAGYTAGDLVVSITASGDAPFGKGCIDYANLQSKPLPKQASCQPIIMVCNPLQAIAARTKDHPITATNVTAISITSGEPALAGSTRMQPSTVLLLALSTALNNGLAPAILPTIDNVAICKTLTSKLSTLSPEQQQALCTLIALEADTFTDKQRVQYVLSPSAHTYALSLATDIVERTPTFTIPPIVPITGKCTDEDHAYASFLVNNTQTPAEAMQVLLNRPPFCLNWPAFPVTESAYFAGYDFSGSGQQHRQATFKAQADNNWTHQFIIDITRKEDKEYFSFSWVDAKTHEKQASFEIEITTLSRLQRELLFKILLNNHSTLVMGRCKRFNSHFMREVKPSNAKLIGRVYNLLLNNIAATLLKLFSNEEEIARKIIDNISTSTISQPPLPDKKPAAMAAHQHIFSITSSHKLDASMMMQLSRLKTYSTNTLISHLTIGLVMGIYIIDEGQTTSQSLASPDIQLKQKTQEQQASQRVLVKRFGRFYEAEDAPTLKEAPAKQSEKARINLLYRTQYKR